MPVSIKKRDPDNVPLPKDYELIGKEVIGVCEGKPFKNGIWSIRWATGSILTAAGCMNAPPPGLKEGCKVTMRQVKHYNCTLWHITGILPHK